MQNQRRYRGLIYVGVLASTTLSNIAPAIGLPTITATATSESTQLPLAYSGPSPIVTKVADVQITTTAINGMTFTVNSSSLTKTDGAPIQLQFLAVNDGASSPSAAAFTTDTNSPYSFSNGGPGTENLDLYIKYLPGQLQDPGYYSNTLQLSVSDNP